MSKAIWSAGPKIDWPIPAPLSDEARAETLAAIAELTGWLNTIEIEIGSARLRVPPAVFLEGVDDEALKALRFHIGSLLALLAWHFGRAKSPTLTAILDDAVTEMFREFQNRLASVLEGYADETAELVLNNVPYQLLRGGAADRVDISVAKPRRDPGEAKDRRHQLLKTGVASRSSRHQKSPKSSRGKGARR